MIDIPDKNLGNKNVIQITSYVLFLSAVGFVCWWLWTSLASSRQVLANGTKDLSIVRQAPLEQTVRAYGQLKSGNASSVIALVSGRVEQIFVRPGKQVYVGDALVKLVNVELEQELEQAQLSLLEQQAQLLALNAQLEQEYLLIENELALSKGEYSLLSSELLAREELYKNNIVSKLDFERSQNELYQGELAVQLAEKKLLSHQKSSTAQEKTGELRLAQAERHLSIAQKSLEKLTIKANLSGVLTDLDSSLQLGTQINANHLVGQIADTQHLYGEMFVDAASARFIQADQLVKLNIKGQEMLGQVESVSPIVEENQVKVDVALNSKLTTTAKPNIDVFGEIIIQSLDSGLIVERPNFVDRPNTTYQLFVLPKNSEYYLLANVKVGIFSDKIMQISNGMQIGDQLVMSVPEGWQGKKRIKRSNVSG